MGDIVEDFPISLHPYVLASHNNNVHGNLGWETLFEEDDIVKSRDTCVSVWSNNIPARKSKLTVPEEM